MLRSYLYTGMHMWTTILMRTRWQSRELMRVCQVYFLVDPVADLKKRARASFDRQIAAQLRNKQERRMCIVSLSAESGC